MNGWLEELKSPPANGASLAESRLLNYTAAFPSPPLPTHTPLAIVSLASVFTVKGQSGWLSAAPGWHLTIVIAPVDASGSVTILPDTHGPGGIPELIS